MGHYINIYTTGTLRENRMEKRGNVKIIRADINVMTLTENSLVPM